MPFVHRKGMILNIINNLTFDNFTDLIQIWHYKYQISLIFNE